MYVATAYEQRSAINVPEARNDQPVAHAADADGPRVHRPERRPAPPWRSAEPCPVGDRAARSSRRRSRSAGGCSHARRRGSPRTYRRRLRDVVRTRGARRAAPTSASQPSSSPRARHVQAAALHLAEPRGGELGVGPARRRSPAQRASRSSTDVSRPWPMLIGPVTSESAASRFARTTSETSTQSRVWVPSPNTVGRLPLDQPAAEDRDHAGLAVNVLAGPVDVAVAQRDRREAVQARVQPAVALGGELALPVRRHRPDRRSPPGSGTRRRRRTARRRSS